MKKDLLCDKVVEYVLSRKIYDLASLTVAGIAREFNISQSFLNRKFRTQRNFPLREYLFREKMSRCAILLSEKSELTIKEVAETIGFSDIDYFTYVFKNHFGISPGRYRECKLGQKKEEVEK